MPGALPMLNRQVVEYAIAVGLATHCTITRYTRFDRKNYFYPDNPQNYQISQLYLPVCRDGHLDIETEAGARTIGIHEIHMEEDAGKLIHEEGGESLIDYNRSGVPLIEVVSQPDMRSAEEVIAYLEKLRRIAQYLGASDCKLQEGSMRVDVNLSVRERGEETLGTRTEMKNLNSFRGIARAIEAEKNRQIQRLEAGEPVIQETRRWDDGRGESYSMRSKEDARDYRYFPEPDLMPVVIDQDWIARVEADRPELQEEKMARYQSQYDLPPYDAAILTEDKHLADLFEAAVAFCHRPKKVSNWLMVEALRLTKEAGKTVDQMDFNPEHLGTLIQMQERGEINGTVAKKIFEEIFYHHVEPETYAAQHGLKTVGDESAIRKAVDEVIKANPQSVADYKAGKKKAMGFLVGQTMRAMGGKAEPGMVNRVVQESLEKA
jgi:aspartyl-tRNA(Asn)/glutamyl-tRNA(Gln) amidotransferase subunit B